MISMCLNNSHILPVEIALSDGEFSVHSSLGRQSFASAQNISKTKERLSKKNSNQWT